MVALRLIVALSALAVVGLARPHGGFGGRHHEPPAFFEGLDDATKEKFTDIFHDHSLHGEAKKAALLKLAESTLTDEQMTLFKADQKKWEERHAERKKEMDAKIAAMSPNARKAAEQLRAIWHDETLDRAAKKEKKEAILKGLTDAERAEVKALHRFGHHHGPRFMHDLPEETRQKFKAIFKDKTLSHAEKDAAMMKLAEETLNSTQLQEFKEHHERMQQFRKKMEERLAKLSPNARKVADAMRDIWMDDKLSFEEKLDKKKELMKDLTDSEREEIKNLWGHHHGGRHGGRGGQGKKDADKDDDDHDDQPDDDEH